MYKEKIYNLLNAIKNSDLSDMDKKDDLTTVVKRLNTFPKYVNSVVTMQNRMAILRFTKEGQEYRDEVSKLDLNRRNCHEAAIISCNFLNNMAKEYNVEAICDIDTTDRYKVADFVGDIVMETYLDGIGKNLSFDEIVKENRIINKKENEDFDLEK